MPPFTLAGLIGSFLDLLDKYPALFAILMAAFLIVTAKSLYLAIGQLRFVLERGAIQRELDAIESETEAEWQREQDARAQRIHRSARSIVHPDEAA